MSAVYPTLPEIADSARRARDEAVRMAWHEYPGDIGAMERRLGVKRTHLYYHLRRLGFVNWSRPRIERPKAKAAPEDSAALAEAIEAEFQRLKAGERPYWGTPAQRALVKAGRAEKVWVARRCYLRVRA